MLCSAAVHCSMWLHLSLLLLSFSFRFCSVFLALGLCCLFVFLFVADDRVGHGLRLFVFVRGAINYSIHHSINANEVFGWFTVGWPSRSWDPGIVGS